MTEQGINKLSEAIERMSLKASLLIKARNLNLSNAQMKVYRKVINNDCILLLEMRSINILIKKGLIQEKPSKKMSSVTLRETLSKMKQALDEGVQYKSLTPYNCGYEAI